jgi:hypothetical protein
MSGHIYWLTNTSNPKAINHYLYYVEGLYKLPKTSALLVTKYAKKRLIFS